MRVSSPLTIHVPFRKLLIISARSLVPFLSAACPANWKLNAEIGSCYYFSESTDTPQWMGAMEACNGMVQDGHLAEIDNAAELQFVLDQLTSIPPLTSRWVGLARLNPNGPYANWAESGRAYNESETQLPVVGLDIPPSCAYLEFGNTGPTYNFTLCQSEAVLNTYVCELEIGESLKLS